MEQRVASEYSGKIPYGSLQGDNQLLHFRREVRVVNSD